MVRKERAACARDHPKLGAPPDPLQSPYAPDPGSRSHTNCPIYIASILKILSETLKRSLGKMTSSGKSGAAKLIACNDSRAISQVKNWQEVLLYLERVPSAE
jgi:hypothetical protein